MHSHRQQLLQQLQLVIDRHGAGRPELIADLEALRRDIQNTDRSPQQFAGDALRLAALVKWFFDLLP